MAFVIIQHLDPKHKSYLAEIVSRETKMNISLIKNGQKPLPNNVYVIPPNTTVTFNKGEFITKKRKTVPKIHMPIDIFMTSIAKDKTHFIIGVLLSGIDSDGVIGMEFIKAEGGVTFAQDKQSSKFFEMPKNAIQGGYIDFVLSPAAIARELNRISRHPYLQPSKPNSPETLIPDGDGELSKIFSMLHANNGIDFKDYKPTTVKRRILRRMLFHKIDDVKEYINYLKKNPVELDDLCKDILINVTSFFRDPEMFEMLKSKVFPQIFANRDTHNPIRIWISGCSTGEEAYSMAISITEFLNDRIYPVPIQIFSTDLSDEGIEKARAGIYPEDIKGNVSPERLKKYFVKVNDKYRVSKSIRKMCIFAKQNLIQDPPFSKIDLISCRNVLIYLGQVLQNNVIPIFHYALSENGYLVLGVSETIGQFTNLFDQIDKKNKIYRKTNIPSSLQMNYTSLHHYAPILEIKRDLEKNIKKMATIEDYYKTADSIILNQFSPASVIVNNNLDVVQFRGRTSDYLKLPQGEPSYNVLKIIRESLEIELNLLIRKAVREDIPVRKNDIELNYDGEKKIINLVIIPIGPKNNAERLYLIVFEDKYHIFYPFSNSDELKPLKAKPESEKLLKLRRELTISKENLQSIIEQLESANEELRAANEEVQSSNEELQSTNEEIETAKEELQSTNEELTTVNEELQNRNEELSTANNDLNNLLSSVNIPIVMLDNNLRIRRFTSHAEKLLNLIPTDVGRKLTDININVSVVNFEKLILEVIKTPTTKEIQVKDNLGRWHFMRIRPYITLENKISGVIVAFIDITELRQSLSEIEISKGEIEKLNLTLEKRVKHRTEEILIANNNLEAEIKERKRVEESLRVLSKHLVNAQEIERKRLSRELHDSINQILSVVKMKLHSTENLKNGEKFVLKDVIEARELLEKAISEVRNISKNLRPLALEDFGLKAVLESTMKEFSERRKVKVDVKIDSMKKNISDDIELNIYRIVQESLHNIEKHSKAKNVKLRLSGKKDKLVLQIQDDGKGYNVEKKTNSNLQQQKYGMIGMRERAESIGGKLNVKSTLGLGTQIELILPY